MFLRSASEPWLRHSLLPTPDDSPLHRGTHRGWGRLSLSRLCPVGGSCIAPSWLHSQVERVRCDWPECHGGVPTPLPNGPVSPAAARLRSYASAARSRRPLAPEIASAGPPVPPEIEPGWLAVQIELLAAGPSEPQCLRPSG